MFPECVDVHGKRFCRVITAEEVASRVREMAERMNRELRDKNPLFLAVLNGSFFFAADLMRHLDFLCEISFVKLASYQGTSSVGRIRELIGLNESLRGRFVVILEDIVDSGLTITYLQEKLAEYSPEEVRVATLLLKREALQRPVEIDYVGFEVPNIFLLGYGLDYDQLGRNLPGIYALSESDNASS